MPTVRPYASQDKRVERYPISMRSVHFRASGHENVIGDHRTTIELTSEDFLTPTGTCIIGIKATQTLDKLDPDIKKLAKSSETTIQLVMSVDNLCETIVGRGSLGLTYADDTSMVIRRSDFECDRTLMIHANKAACDLDRTFVQLLQDSDITIECELQFFT
jgi:hypothetical protein